MSRHVRLAAAGLAVLAVVAAVLYVVSRSGQGNGEPEDDVVPQAAALTVDGEPDVRLDGDRLVLRLPLSNPGARGLQVVEVGDLPAGFSSLLPEDGLVVPAGRSAELALGWNGPDCEGDAPEQLLPELALVVRVDADQAADALPRTDLDVDTAAADELLLRARQSACADQPAPTPADEVVTDGPA